MREPAADDPPRRGRSRATSIVVAVLLTAFVAVPAIGALAFVQLGRSALAEADAAREAADAEPDASGPLAAPETARIRELTAIGRLEPRSSGDPLPDWVLDPDGAERLDADAVRSEIAANEEALERLEAVMRAGPIQWPADPLGTVGASPDTLARLDELVSLLFLRAWLAAEDGDLPLAIERFGQTSWALLFERSDEPAAQIRDATLGFARLRGLELLLDGQAPSVPEVAALRRALGPSPEGVGVARLRRVFRVRRDRQLAAIGYADAPPLSGAWVLAHTTELHTRAIERCRLPADRALPELRYLGGGGSEDLFALDWVAARWTPSRVDFQYDYERSAIVRQWHQLARAALALLEHRARDGALPATLPELGTHDTVDPPIYRRVDDGFELEMPTAWDWPIPVTTWRWRPPSEDELDRQGDDADPADEDEHPADDGVVQ